MPCGLGHLPWQCSRAGCDGGDGGTTTGARFYDGPGHESCFCADCEIKKRRRADTQDVLKVPSALWIGLRRVSLLW